MAQSGFTPIQLYYSTTAGNAPLDTNLVNGELALNINDGVLYYKDSAGTVQVLASGNAVSTYAVNVATTVNLAALSGLLTIDSVTLIAGQRVLVKDQTLGQNNGIYVASAIAWSRAIDANTSAEIAGRIVSVRSGSTNGGEQYATTFKSTDTLGTTAMPWYQVALQGTSVGFTTVDTTNLEVTNIKALDGTASISLADSTGIATFGKATIISTTDNTNAALRVTQLGTGNALLVEDTTNPDASPFVIDASGNVVVGATSLVSGFGPMQVLGTNSLLSTVGQFSADPNGAILSLNKSRNTTVGSPSTIVANNDSLGEVRFYGADGVQFFRGAVIDAEVDGTPAVNVMPGRLVFSTTPNASNTPVERMRIDNLGSVGIGTTNTTAVTLGVAKNITGATTSYGISNSGIVQSDVTGNANYFRTSANTQATAFTLTNLFHYLASQNTIGAGSTVTNQYGFYVDNGLVGATNNYSFYGNLAAPTAGISTTGTITSISSSTTTVTVNHNAITYTAGQTVTIAATANVTALTNGAPCTLLTLGTTTSLPGATTGSVTFTDSGDLVTYTAHGMPNGTPIFFSVVTTTTGISVNTLYFVINATTNTFQVSATKGGAALALTTNGTGTCVQGVFTATGVGTGTATVTLNIQGSGKTVASPASGSFTYTTTTSQTFSAITVLAGSVTVSTRYNLYMVGTADNYLAGNLGIGTTAPAAALDVTGAPAGALSRFLNTTAPTLDNSTHAGESIFLRSGGTAGLGNAQAVLAFGKADGTSLRSGSAIASIQTTADADQIGLGFYVSTNTGSAQTMSQAAIIDNAGNVGIGTATPVSKLQVSESKNGASVEITVANTYYLATSTDETVTFQGEFFQNDLSANRSAGYMQIGKSGDFSNAANASAFMAFATRNAGTIAEKMRIDSAGNVGIGVTPSAWVGNTAMQVGSLGAISSSATVPVTISSNAFSTSAGWAARYITTGTAAAYQQVSGAHVWYTAPSGTAGASASVSTGQSYTVSVLGSSTLAQWQAFFSALVALPTVGQVITATASGSIVGGGTVTQNITFIPEMTLTATGALAFGSSTAYGTSGQALISAGNATPTWATQFLSITFIIDAGGSVITTGIKGDLTIPFACTITEWTLLADQTGSIVVDIWKDTYANYPPTVADTITGSAKPTITTAVKGQSSTLTGWTAAITAGDTLRFNVDSITSCTRVTLSLKVSRT